MVLNLLLHYHFELQQALAKNMVDLEIVKPSICSLNLQSMFERYQHKVKYWMTFNRSNIS